MTNKITAEQARKLMPINAQNEVDKVYNDIRIAARAGETELRPNGEFWTKQGYKRTAEYNKACDILRDDGYNVKFFYEENQFVNMYTIVSWRII